MSKKTTTDMNIDHYSDAQVVGVLEREMGLKNARIAELERQLVLSKERLEKRMADDHAVIEGLRASVVDLHGQMRQLSTAVGEARKEGFSAGMREVQQHIGKWL
tara:strand:+ start:1816 stop:2127 length:312 start_codon:yes stop_codon:yes gene_type:complete